MTEYSIATALEAAERVYEYIYNHKTLPNYVLIQGSQVKMPVFLDLASRAVLQIESKNQNNLQVLAVAVPNMASPASPSGQIPFSNYMDAFSRLYGFITANGRAPATLGTTIGKIGFNEMIYAAAFTCTHYKRNRNLPSHITINGGSSVAKTQLWLALEAAMNKTFNNDEELEAAFKNYYDYQYYMNDLKKPYETINALKEPGGEGVNCVDVAQIVMEILEAMGYTNVNIWRGTFKCGGHVWVTYGANNTVFDAAGMMKYGYVRGQYMCSGSPWDLNKNPAWATNDDGVT